MTDKISRDDLVKLLAKTEVDYSKEEIEGSKKKPGLLSSFTESVGRVGRGLLDVVTGPKRYADEKTQPYVDAMEKDIGKGNWDLIEGGGTMLGSVSGGGAAKVLPFPKAYKAAQDVSEEIAEELPENVTSFSKWAKDKYAKAKETLDPADFAKAQEAQGKLPFQDFEKVQMSPEHMRNGDFDALKKTSEYRSFLEKAKPEVKELLESLQPKMSDSQSTKNRLARAREHIIGMSKNNFNIDELRATAMRQKNPRSYYKSDEYKGLIEKQEKGLLEKAKEEGRGGLIEFPKDRASKTAPAVLDENIPQPIDMHSWERNKRVDEHFNAQKTVEQDALRFNPEAAPKPLEKKKTGQLLDFPKERMGPVQDRSDIPFDQTFRAHGENVVQFPNKQEDYQRLMKAGDPAKSRPPVESGSALNKFMARFPGKDGDRVLREMSKHPETSPYVYLAGDIHNSLYAPKGSSWSSGKWGDTNKGVGGIPRGLTPDKLPMDAQGRRVLGEGVELGTNEPLMWMDQKYGVTKQLLEEAFDTPLTVKTRSDLIATDNYIEKLNPSKHEVEMHILTPNEEIGKIVEPGAPSMKRRMLAIKKLIETGVPVRMKVDILVPESGTVLPSSLENVKKDWEEFFSTYPEYKALADPNYIKIDRAAVERLKRELGE